MLNGNFSGQLGIFSASWENIWHRKPDQVLYRKKAQDGGPVMGVGAGVDVGYK